MYGIQLKRKSPISLVKQLHVAIINLIHSGEIKANESLPSTRELAKELGISRNTVNEAYELLIAEGYIYSRAGAGYKVHENLTMQHCELSATNETKCKKQDVQYNFRLGVPDISVFPFSTWYKYQRKAQQILEKENFLYSDPQGNWLLRKEISQWLFRSRGLKVDEKNIFITTGTTQAINLGIQLVKDIGELFVTENPCYFPVISALERFNAPYSTVSVDEHGIAISEVKAITSKISGVYVTPSHQFPLGSILSAERRVELIKLANEQNFYIFEDDYDGEFRYKKSPLIPLYSIEPERVIYMGTFSKTLFPSLRIGFVILPEFLHERWRILRNSIDRENSVFDQVCLALFLKDKKVDLHIKAMNTLYEKKLHILKNVIKNYLPENAKILGESAGINIAIEIPNAVFDTYFYEKCAEQSIGISFYPCSPCQKEFVGNSIAPNILHLGYGNIALEEIEIAFKILAEIIKESIQEGNVS